jgi:hypothetical protein
MHLSFIMLAVRQAHGPESIRQAHDPEHVEGLAEGLTPQQRSTGSRQALRGMRVQSFSIFPLPPGRTGIPG